MSESAPSYYDGHPTVEGLIGYAFREQLLSHSVLVRGLDVWNPAPSPAMIPIYAGASPRSASESAVRLKNAANQAYEVLGSIVERMDSDTAEKITQPCWRSKWR
jgi:hypothetical protein